MKGHKGKYLGGLEDAIDRNQIMVRMLETDVTRAIVNCLNAFHIEQPRVIRRRGVAVFGLLTQHGLNSLSKSYHYIGIL